MALLTVEDLSLGYEGQAIVKGLNFSVSAGDYLCIVGENGFTAGRKRSSRRTICGAWVCRI